MGTHPIFESDFDCLTDGLIGQNWDDIKCSSAVGRLYAKSIYE